MIMLNNINLYKKENSDSFTPRFFYPTKKWSNDNELINIKKEEPNKNNPKINQSFIKYRPNKSFVLPNPFNNNKNNNNIQNNIHDKGNMTLDENNQKLKIKRNSSPEISDSNKKEILINAENIKFKSTGNFSL